MLCCGRLKGEYVTKLYEWKTRKEKRMRDVADAERDLSRISRVWQYVKFVIVMFWVLHLLYFLGCQQRQSPTRA